MKSAAPTAPRSSHTSKSPLCAVGTSQRTAWFILPDSPTIPIQNASKPYPKNGLFEIETKTSFHSVVRPVSVASRPSNDRTESELAIKAMVTAAEIAPINKEIETNNLG